MKFVVFISFCFSAPVYLISGYEPDITGKQCHESLFRMAKTNDIETLKTILKSIKGLLKCKDEDDRTLLHVAAMEGSLDVIQYLVAEQHVDVDVIRSRYNRFTPLYEAVTAGQLEAVKLLIELGADKKIRFYGSTLLHKAATTGNVEVLKLLLSPLNIDDRNKLEETPAYLAAEKGKLEALRFLLENGADPYAKEMFGDTLMHAAVRSGQVDVVRELSRYEQLINAPNRNALPIELPSNMQIVKELVDAGSIITDYSIYKYVNKKDFDIVKYLVAQSGKVNACMTWRIIGCKESLLMYLLTKDPLPFDLIKFILDRGADVNIKYNLNITALHRAAYNEKEHTLEIIKLLLDKGADVNSPDDDGYTPLDYARGEENHDVFNYLRTFGALTRDSIDRS